jgi:2-methylisocitrate lyase-like PEP mutase family enzyme
MIPGAFNGLVARLAVDNGFKALYISSGVPDIGLRTLTEFGTVIR